MARISKREAAMHKAVMDDLTTFRCAHCGASETYNSPDFYLAVWWMKSEAFDEAHRACRDRAKEPQP